MTYNNDNETREELLSLQKDNRGNYIKVSLIKKNDKGTSSLDIREFWTNDKDEICPTKKGVRIKDEQAAEVINSMLKILEYDELQDVIDTASSLMNSADGDGPEDNSED